MEQGLECGAGLALPEAAGLDAAGREPGGRGEAGGADHRGQRVLAPAHGRPAQAGGQPFGEALRVEDRDRSASLAGGEGGGDVVGPGRGGDDRAGCVEDRVDDDVQALARAGRAEQQDRVLDGRPHALATGAAEQVADVGRFGLVERRPQGSAAREQGLLRGHSSYVPAGGDSGQAAGVVRRLVLHRPDAPPQHQRAGNDRCDHQGEHEPVDPCGEAVGAERSGRVARAG